MILKRAAKRLFLPNIDNIPKELFPSHVLIIPDGNGRWAEKFHKDATYGHERGFAMIKKIIRELQNIPVNILTIWAFSSDNWKRSKKETSALMKIYELGVNEALPELIERNVKFIFLGRKDRIPQSLKRAIENAEKQTRRNGPKMFCLALDFSGQDQEIRIMEKVIKLPKNTKINLDLIKSLRDADGKIPPADLIIRTSGEQRTSDLGWLSQNSEFYSINKFLPDANARDFLLALVDYTKRERRFGARTR